MVIWLNLLFQSTLFILALCLSKRLLRITSDAFDGIRFRLVLSGFFWFHLVLFDFVRFDLVRFGLNFLMKLSSRESRLRFFPFDFWPWRILWKSFQARATWMNFQRTGYMAQVIWLLGIPKRMSGHFQKKSMTPMSLGQWWIKSS